MVCQLMNVEEMMKLEKSSFGNHCSSNTAKKYQWCLNYSVKVWQEMIFTWSQSASFLQNAFWLQMEKIDKFTVEKTGRHHLNQVIKVN